MATHNNVRLTSSADVVLMYLPLTATIEEIWQNNLFVAPRQWNQDGTIAIDKKLWNSELVVQGTFFSTDAPAPADFVTDLRAIAGAPAGWVFPNVITARNQFDFMLDKILTTSKLFLYYNSAHFKYAAVDVDISAGKYPPVISREVRVIGEGSKNTLDFTIRFAIAQPEV